MGTTFRILAIGQDVDRVRDWFAALPEPPVLLRGPECDFLHFATLGALADDPASSAAAGGPDPRRSPVASFFPPARRRGALWTAAELHFLATPANRFPPLAAVARRFRAWLGEFERVTDGARPGEWDYYLEGSLRNRDGPIHALPEAMAALRAAGGQYFVAHDDPPGLLDGLCRQLRRRGVEGITDWAVAQCRPPTCGRNV